MTVTRLGEIADVIAGQSPPGETYNTTGVGLPFFQGKTDFGSRHPVARVWCSAPERIAEPGDVLISVRAPVGPSNVADVPSCIGRGLAAIRARPRLDPAFLAWFMKHQEPSLAALGQGSTFHAITRREIEDIEVSVLPLDEQRRIAKELRDQFDSLQILQASSHARASSSSVLRKILMSEPFHLDLKYPAQCRTIGSISRIQTGYAFRSEWFRETGIRLLRNANVGHRRIDWTDSARLDAAVEAEFDAFQLREGDIVLSLDRPLVSTGLKVARLTESDVPSLLLQRVARLIPSPSVDPDYLFAFLLSSQFEESISGHDQSLGVPHISPRQVGAITIPVPSIGDQRRIAAELRERLGAIDAMDSAIRVEQEAIDTLPAALLRRAFSEVAA